MKHDQHIGKNCDIDNKRLLSLTYESLKNQ